MLFNDVLNLITGLYQVQIVNCDCDYESGDIAVTEADDKPFGKVDEIGEEGCRWGLLPSYEVQICALLKIFLWNYVTYDIVLNFHWEKRFHTFVFLISMRNVKSAWVSFSWASWILDWRMYLFLVCAGQLFSFCPQAQSFCYKSDCSWPSSSLQHPLSI